MSKAPPKPKGTKKDRGPLLAVHAEALRTGLGVSPDGQVVKGKLTAALNIWSIMLAGDDEREEVYKFGICPLLHVLLERGDVEERHAAMGCLSVLAQSEKHLADVVTNRVLATAAALLMFDHARGKLPAVQLLRICAARPDFSSRVADVALPALVEVLKSDGLPGWGQMRQAQTHAASTLKLLLENVEGEPPELRQLRRVAVLQLGAVAPLAAMVASAPRLPPPALMPAPPPVLTKKKGPGSRHKGSKAEPQAALGTRDAAATVAAACLRYLALVPEFVEEFMATGALPGIVAGLRTCGEEQAAYITGLLWETTAETAVAEAAVAAGGVVVLLHVISRNLAGCKIGKPKKAAPAKSDKKDSKAGASSATQKDAKEGGKSGKGGKGKSGSGSASDAVNFADIAVCNATGALQHLTFIDAAKHQVTVHGGVPILTAALKVANPQTYENASGTLWNAGLDVRNGVVLQAGGAPGFLARPVPDAWLTRGEADDSDEEEDEDGGEGGAPSSPERRSPEAVRDRVFLTQQ